MSGVPGMHERLSTSPSYAARVRARIKAGGIVFLLQEHIAGKREMTASQVQASLGLLRKVVPDRSESKHDISATIRLIEPSSDQARRMAEAVIETARLESAEPADPGVG